MTSMPKTRREKEIWEACDSLRTELDEQTPITGDRIFSKLLALGYKKGSPNEIYKYRRSWKAARGLDNVEKQANVTALQLTDPISRAVALVHQELAQEAQQDMADLKVAYDAEWQALKQQYDATQHELQHSVEKLITLEKQLSEQNETIVELTEKEAQVQQQLDASHTAYQQLTTASEHQQSQLSAQVTALQASEQSQKTHYDEQLARLQAQHDKERDSDKALLEKQRVAQMMKFDALQTKQQQLEITHAETVQAKQSLINTIEQLRVDNDTLLTSQQNTQQALEALSAEHQRLQTDYAVLKAHDDQWQAQQQWLQNMDQLIMPLATKLDTLHVCCQSLATQQQSTPSQQKKARSSREDT